jgi:hypothetical protein
MATLSVRAAASTRKGGYAGMGENHRDHGGKPPPRRQHDGEVPIP